MKPTPLTIAYAALTLLGAVVPWTFNLRFMQEAGGPFDLGTFVAGGFANAAASSLSSDLVIGATAFLIWMIVEARRLGMRHWWAYVVIFNLVAFACAAPLFLLMRERAIGSAAGRGAGPVEAAA